MRDHSRSPLSPDGATLLAPDPTLWAQALDAVRDLVFIHDADGRLLQANRRYCERVGAEFEQIRGRRYWDVYPRRDAPLPDTSPEAVDPVRGTYQEHLIEADDGLRFLSREYPVLNDDGGRTYSMRVLEEFDPDADWTTDAADHDRQLRSLIRGVPAAYQSLGVDGTLLEVNDTWLSHMGFAREDVIGRDFSDFLTKEHREVFPDCFAKFISNGGTEGREFHLLKHDGTVFTASFVGCAVYDDEGRFVHSHCILQNLSERRLAEDALRSSEERLSLALEATDDGIWDLNRKTGETYFSPQIAARLGYSDDEIAEPGEFMARYVHPEDRSRIWSMIRHGLARQQEHLHFEYRLLAHDGSWRWFQTRGKVVERFEDGSPSRIIGVNTDITGQKQLVGEILSLQKRLQNAIDAMPSILVGVDFGGAVTLWNEEARRATGIGSDRAVGRPFNSLHPFFAELGGTLRAAARLGTHQFVPKAQVHLFDGDRIVDVLVYPYSSEGVDGFMVRIDDVTDRSRMEQMLMQTEKMMSIGGLSAGIAHEINNPLGGVLQGLQNVERRLFADLPGNRTSAESRDLELDDLRAYMVERDVPRLLEGIRKSGQRAAAIVANMLQFARTSDGEMQHVDLTRLVSNTVELAAVDYDLSKNWDFRNISIVLELEDDLPRVPVQSTGVEQVLLNLLGNAAQALQEQTELDVVPRIVIRAYREADRVRIEVQDNGPGMSPEVRQRVFDPFFTTKPPGIGTGLGLAVSHHIITEVHRGDMTVDSQLGRGATFTIRLPLEVSP